MKKPTKRRGASVKPSGAANRKRRKAAQARAQAEDVARGVGLISKHLARHKALGPPPASAVDGTTWMISKLLVEVDDIATDPVVDTQARRKLLIDAARAVAQLSPRAIFTERFLALEEKVYGRHRPVADLERADGLEVVE